MPQIIPNYREPGAYSTINIIPTTTSQLGPPVVAILGQARQGPYVPVLFYDSNDAQNLYSTATLSNPLPNAIQIAFENGATRVLGLNVEPSNSFPAYLTLPNSGLPGIPTSTFPTSAYIPAATGANAVLDPVTQQPVNVDGTVAGIFYVQDFDPSAADPVLNSTPQATQQAFATSQGNLLQYIKYGQAPTLNGVQQVPYSNSNMIRVSVPAVIAGAPPDPNTYQSGFFGVITQAQWNSFSNALAMVNAIVATPNAPLGAAILVPDANQLTNYPLGWQNVYASVGNTTATIGASSTLIQSIGDAYAYAINYGVFQLYALEPGAQHEIVMGLFATSSFDEQTGTKPFGLPVSFAGVNNTNPYIIFNNGIDGVVTNQSYIDAINNQLTTVRADLLVVLNTDSSLQQVIKDHVTYMSSHDERNERIALVSGPISELYTTSIQNAQNLQGGVDSAERMVYIWPTGAYRNDAVLGTSVTLDGTFLAAACAGVLASNDAATPLTRKSITGFTDITIKTSRTQANSIAQNGICIIENDPVQGIRCRDGITCDPTSPETQEISVVRQIDFMAQQVRNTLDASFIATKITVNTLPAVTTTVKNVLQNLVTTQIIYGFQNVTARINPNDPRQIDVYFLMRPAYPCKYIEIYISVTSSLTGF